MSIVFIAMLTVAAATLEAVFAIYLGCIAYGVFWGCADCDDISERLRVALSDVRRPSNVDDVAATSSVGG